MIVEYDYNCTQCGFGTDYPSDFRSHGCADRVKEKFKMGDTEEKFERLQETIANKNVFVQGVKYFVYFLSAMITLIIAGGVAGVFEFDSVQECITWVAASLAGIDLVFMGAWFAREFGAKPSSSFELENLARREYNKAMSQDHSDAIQRASDTKGRQIES